MNIASGLDAAIRAVCPALEGVSIGDPADRTTWRLDFGPDATDAQRQAARSALQAFVLATSDPFTLYKTDIEGRMTDDELTAFDAALSAATVRARRLWTDCQMVHSDAAFFATLTAQLTAAFGSARASIILAKAS